MRTRLTEILGVEHPVMLAGMGGVSYSKLVAAVSEAGGFGCMGASTMPLDEMVQEMKAVQAATSKPYGVDLLTAMPGSMVAQVEQIIAHGAKVFAAGLGVPREVVELCHENDLVVVNICGKVQHAIKAVAAGCDVVVAQGTEGGGHTGTVAGMALIPQVVDAVGDKVPVVAAGSIFDGRGLAAALAFGADGVWVGTRFIATPEARAVSGYKEALINTSEDGTVITRAYTGKTLRAVRNEYNSWWENHTDELQAFPMQVMRSMQDGAMHLGADENTPDIDPNKECYPAGQGTGGITDIVPAGELVHRMVAEAEQAIAGMAKYA